MPKKKKKKGRNTEPRVVSPPPRLSLNLLPTFSSSPLPFPPSRQSSGGIFAGAATGLIRHRALPRPSLPTLPLPTPPPPLAHLKKKTTDAGGARENTRRAARGYSFIFFPPQLLEKWCSFVEGDAAPSLLHPPRAPPFKPKKKGGGGGGDLGSTYATLALLRSPFYFRGRKAATKTGG